MNSNKCLAAKQIALGFLTSLAATYCLSLAAQEILKPIQPRFSPDPQVYAGTSGGKTALKALAGTEKVNGQCQGLANSTPGHVLRIREPFGLLSMKVLGGNNNLSLLVKGPDGVYCRDASNPELLGAWGAGTYEIWIGSKSGDRIPYTLSISETRQ